MKTPLIITMIFSVSMASNIIFEFNKKSILKDWVIVNDAVMGGKSSGSIQLNSEGYGVFKGFISLDNNGGFSLVRYRFKKKPIKEFTKIVLTIKGDKKEYQFRIKSNSSDSFSYITTFNTSGNWQEIQVPLNSMTPAFRGRKLDIPNFCDDSIEEIAFLFGNKKEENFQLIIDKIVFE